MHARKKKKYDKTTHIVSLDKEDIGLLVDVVAKVTETSLEGLSTQQMQVANKIAEHVNKITDAINEVKTIVEAETYGVDLGDTLAVPLLLLHWSQV